MRAVLQGLDPADSWRRYLALHDTRVDLRLVKATIQWIRSEFAAAATRERRPGTARLVLLEATATPPNEPTLPSLEEFVVQAGLEDFSETEQIEAYQAQHGAVTTRQRRSRRLLKRQLEALGWLETLASRAPAPADRVENWLHPQLAQKLAGAGVDTLGMLLDRIQARGTHWHRGIWGIGARKSARIVQWLRMQEVALGQRVGAHADLPPRTWSTALRQHIVPRGWGVLPLEKLTLPEACNGATGTNRAPAGHCRLDASNDLQAIHCWLGPAPPCPTDQATDNKPARSNGRPMHTYRTYRKEAERLLLWATRVRQKPLSSLTNEDVPAYFAFLADPQPAAEWCSTRQHERWSSAWRPFNGPLSARSIAHAGRILRAMFRFLTRQGYLRQALFDERQADSSAHQNKFAHTYVASAQRPPRVSLDAPPADADLALRLSICAAALPGRPLRQLCDARLSDLAPDPSDPTRWLLQLPPDKGRGTTPLCLPEHVMALLQQRLANQGCAVRPGVPLHPDWHLLAPSQRWLGLRRNQAALRSQGIRPGTLCDQLRSWRRNAITPSASGPTSAAPQPP